MSQNKYSGTRTEQNLLAAFAGESQARNKYTYFASKAKKEGYTADKAENLRHAGELIREAAARGANVVTLPEIYPNGNISVSSSITSLANCTALGLATFITSFETPCHNHTSCSFSGSQARNSGYEATAACE